MNKNLWKLVKKKNREDELEHRQLHGKPRSKLWGGKPLSRKERHSTKQTLIALRGEKQNEYPKI